MSTFAILLTTVVAAEPARQLADWTALVAHNAASNPHAVFDVNDVAGFEAWTKLSTLAPSMKKPTTMPTDEIGAILGGTGDKPSVDWRTKGAVTAVKNQGAFGTCWSFAAAENLEGLNFRQGHTLTNLSNQELIDCTACQGRSADCSFDYLLNNTGGSVDTEDSYPYLGTVGKCITKQGTASTVKLNTYGRTQDADGTGNAIVASLMKYGPMGHGVDASCFAGYKGGVITNCTKASIDHAVLMVAAGTDDDLKVDYYTIKNSWGGKWGEHGYVRIARGAPKQAGIGSTVWTM